VREETGVRAALRVPLPPVRYRVGDRPKVVDYWEMRALAVPPFRPNSEVDELTWSPAAAAAERVHYLHDARLLREWAQRPWVTAVVLLVAGTGTDSDDLCPMMALFAPSALHTRPGAQDSLAPLSAALNIPVTVDPRLEHTGAAQIRRLAGHRSATVVCLSRTALCAALAQLSGTDPQSWKSAGADAWLLPFAGDRALAPAPLHWSI
jgi:8-oxo-(d)GTP phosphatase